MPRIFTETFTIDRGEEEIDIEVTYTMTPVIPAQTYGPAENCYPAEGGEVEIQTVERLDNNQFLNLLPDEEARIVEWAQQNTEWPDDRPDY